MFLKGKGGAPWCTVCSSYILQIEKDKFEITYVVGFKPVRSSNCAHATKTIAKCFALFRANWNELRASSSDIFL